MPRVFRIAGRQTGPPSLIRSERIRSITRRRFAVSPTEYVQPRLSVIRAPGWDAQLNQARSAEVRVLSTIAAVMASGLCFILASDARAQGQPQAAAPAQSVAPTRNVGVIDIGHILQNHPTLKARMDSVKARMEAADKEMQAKREAIIKQMEQLKERYNEGTPEYDRAEKQIAEQDTEFRLELIKKRKEFESAQAEVLFEVHGQITQLLKYLNEAMGIQVVLQVSRQTVDPKKPETLEIAMSQNVLFFDKNVDLTGWVLEALQKQLGSTGQGQARSATGTQGPVVR
jgi:Skp family chaperone for outer membrane proteins